jgi:hypothetical protein
MRTVQFLNFASVVVIGIASYVFVTRTRLDAQQSAAVKIKADDIGGVVSSGKGPEAGVWVISETTDLPTRYIKEVVTDDRGRYLIRPPNVTQQIGFQRPRQGWCTGPHLLSPGPHLDTVLNMNR